MQDGCEVLLATYEELLAYASKVASVRAISDIKDEVARPESFQLHFQDVTIYHAAEGYYFKVMTDCTVTTSDKGRERSVRVTYHFGQFPRYEGTEVFGYDVHRCCFYVIKLYSIDREEFEKKGNAEPVFYEGYIEKRRENSLTDSENEPENSPDLENSSAPI